MKSFINELIYPGKYLAGDQRSEFNRDESTI
jgi:hypothetical protein